MTAAERAGRRPAFPAYPPRFGGGPEPRGNLPRLPGLRGDPYAAQGLTLHGGVVVDLRRAGGLHDDDWWLAIYVMLSRARQLTNLILVGVTEQVEDLLRRVRRPV